MENKNQEKVHWYRAGNKRTSSTCRAMTQNSQRSHVQHGVSGPGLFLHSIPHSLPSANTVLSAYTLEANGLKAIYFLSSNTGLKQCNLWTTYLTSACLWQPEQMEISTREQWLKTLQERDMRQHCEERQSTTPCPSDCRTHGRHQGIHEHSSLELICLIFLFTIWKRSQNHTSTVV